MTAYEAHQLVVDAVEALQGIAEAMTLLRDVDPSGHDPGAVDRCFQKLGTTLQIVGDAIQHADAADHRVSRQREDAMKETPTSNPPSAPQPSPEPDDRLRRTRSQALQCVFQVACAHASLGALLEDAGELDEETTIGLGTLRGVAEKAVDLVYKKLGKKTPRSTTAETPIWGGRIERWDDAGHCRHRAPRSYPADPGTSRTPDRRAQPPRAAPRSARWRGNWSAPRVVLRTVLRRPSCR